MKKMSKFGWLVVILALILEFYSLYMMHNICPPYQSCLGYYYERYKVYSNLSLMSSLMGLGGLLIVIKGGDKKDAV